MVLLLLLKKNKNICSSTTSADVSLLSLSVVSGLFSHRCSLLSHTDPLLPTYFTPTSDMDPSPPSFTNSFLPDGSDGPLPGETTTSSAGSPRFLGHGFNENLIPIYCSILAAVVVGFVAYIVFKRSVSREKKTAAASWLKTIGFLRLIRNKTTGQRGCSWCCGGCWMGTDVARGREMPVRCLL